MSTMRMLCISTYFPVYLQVGEAFNNARLRSADRRQWAIYRSVDTVTQSALEARVSTSRVLRPALINDAVAPPIGDWRHSTLAPASSRLLRIIRLRCLAPAIDTFTKL
jgi:hypothetical protein